MNVRSRRVGTLTLGISLISSGVMFIAHLIVPDAITYALIFKLWPVIFILLGIEVILSYLFNSDEKYKYDGWAVFIMLGMICFAGAMAGCQILLESGRGCISF